MSETGSLLAQLSALGIRPKKGLGQNFLVDPAHRGRIVAAAGLTPDDIVLEVGPGPGVLTELIAQQAGRVVAVELDDRLIPFLRERFADRPHVEIVHGDILKLDVGALMLGAGSWGLEAGSWKLEAGKWQPGAGAERLAAGGWKPEADSWKLSDQLPVSSFQYPASSIQLPVSSFQYKVIANLPYYITSAAIRHLLESAPPPALLVLTVQREVAERMVASPPQMSLLALGVQFYCTAQIVDRIPAGAFFPRPKVDSAVVRLVRRERPIATGVTAEAFFRVARAGFGQPRKQLRNALAAGLGMTPADVERWLMAAGIAPQRRAETLTLEEWAALAKVVPFGG